MRKVRVKSGSFDENKSNRTYVGYLLQAASATTTIPVRRSHPSPLFRDFFLTFRFRCARYDIEANIDVYGVFDERFRMNVSE